jgi:periplasmic protein TonB
MFDGHHNRQELSYDATGARPGRHVASFAASIAAHAAIVGLILCFASPVARAPGDWVLAYLVEGTDGDAGRGGARAGAGGAASIHAPTRPAPPRSAPPLAARKPRPRIEEPDSEVASLAPVRSVAPARSADSEHDEHSHSRDDSPGGASGSFSAAVSSVGTSAGPGGGSAVDAGNGDGGNGNGNGGGGNGNGDGGDPNSIAHADYARNPPPAYPVIARRRAEQGTVTVSVLVGADGSVERAEVADSSGFDTLDAAALETVRSRWRFVPARHGGIAVESWVLVPIRFALIEAKR